jgi:hypothetical protein
MKPKKEPLDEIIAVRCSAKSKEKFFKFCEKHALEPSNLLREIVEKTPLNRVKIQNSTTKGCPIYES